MAAGVGPLAEGVGLAQPAGPDLRWRSQAGRQGIMIDLTSLTRRHALGAALTGTGFAASAAAPAQPVREAARDGMISVRDLGATGDGQTDDTAAVQGALDRAAAAPDGGTVWFPPGRYAVRNLSCVNRDPSRFHPILRLLGAGPAVSSIVPLVEEAVLIDASGRSGFRIESLSIDSGARLSRIGLLLARRRESPNCNATRIRDVTIEGAFSHAAVVSVAAESTVWSECHFHNGHIPARNACLITSQVPEQAGLASGGPHVEGPNTDNRFFGCTFYTPYHGARPVHLRGAAGTMFFGCTIIAGDATDTRLVTYLPDKGIFNGPVGWFGCHFEVFGRGGVIHFLDAPIGLSYYQNLQCQGGSLVVATGIGQVDFDRTDSRRQPVLRNWRWQSPPTPPGVDRVDFHAYLLDGCSVDARVAPHAGDLIALGAIDRSDVCANEVRTPQVVGLPLRLVSDGPPGTGTWPAGAFVDNLRAVRGQPAGWRVARGGGGTIAPDGGRGRSGDVLRPGQIVSYQGEPRTVWHVAPSGHVVLEGMASAQAYLRDLAPHAPSLLELPPL